MELAGISICEVKAQKGDGEMNYGHEVYDILPEELFHITSRSNWEKIQSQGFLGFFYKDWTNGKSFWVDQNNHEVDRSWQKPGWGVFLATDPSSAKAYMAGESSLKIEDNLITLKVNKSNLSSDKVYLDGDVFVDFFNDLETVPEGNWSIFYADKIPLSGVSVEEGAEKENYNRLTGRTREIFKQKIIRLEENLRTQELNPNLLEGIITPFLLEVSYHIENLENVSQICRVFYWSERDSGWFDSIVFVGKKDISDTERETVGDLLGQKSGLDKYYKHFLYYTSILDCLQDIGVRNISFEKAPKIKQKLQ